MNIQENLFELSSLGSFVLLRKIPKIKMAIATINPIILFISHFIKLRNHFMMRYSFVFKVRHEMIFLFLRRT